MSKLLPVARRKKDGFKGQKAIVLPDKIVKDCEKTPVIRNLLITDIGFYPKAEYHFRKRATGISQHILIYCVDGKGWVRIMGEEYAVQSGQFFVIPAETIHQYGSAEHAPWSIYWLHFKGAVSGEHAAAMTKNFTRFVHSVKFSEERIRLFESIYSTLESGYSTENLGYINMCLWYFLSSFSYDDIFHAPFTTVEKDAIDLSVEFMKKNVEHSLTLKELAIEAHISPSHYAALFKKKTGYPPLEYFNQMKVQKACQFLQFTNLQIKEIGYKLGINDPYYFSRFFSNIMGMSPQEYRKKSSEQ